MLNCCGWKCFLTKGNSPYARFVNNLSGKLGVEKWKRVSVLSVIWQTDEEFTLVRSYNKVHLLVTLWKLKCHFYLVTRKWFASKKFSFTFHLSRLEKLSYKFRKYSIWFFHITFFISHCTFCEMHDIKTVWVAYWNLFVNPNK